MPALTSIESVIINNSNLARHPRLTDFIAQYQSALDSGIDPDPAVLSEMFKALIEISVSDPSLAADILTLEATIVEEVVARDPSLETNDALTTMLTFYTDAVSSEGHAPSDEAIELILAALDGLSTTDSALQDAITQLTSAIAPQTLPPTFGVVLRGIAYGDASGVSVSSAGDMNGDGFDDILIGASAADPDGVISAGETYVVFGGQSLDAIVDLATLGQEGGLAGFMVKGIDERDGSGRSVSSAGDINADGFDDILIGAPDADPDGLLTAGEAYIIFGGQSFGAEVDLARLGQEDGAAGFVIKGLDDDFSTGLSVSSAGDLNGDGFDDFLIGATGASRGEVRAAGATYLVFGGQAFGPELDLATLGQSGGAAGFVLRGTEMTDLSGNSVSSAGDVNGDGFDDILITAPIADPDGVDSAGRSYVIFGGQEFGAEVDLADVGLTGGVEGFALKGVDAYDISGFSASSAGDINGDGFDDILIGAHRADQDTGETYLVFGGQTFGAEVDLATLGQAGGAAGFVLKGVDPADNSGRSVTSAGDINGDGFDDILIGAPNSDPNGQIFAGESYIVFGGQTFGPEVDLAAIGQTGGASGFVLHGIDGLDGSGFSVASAGDVNGDGFDDLLIGAPGASRDAAYSSGETYLIYGGADIFEFADRADGANDGVISLESLGLTPSDYDFTA
jgi:hypothetical protein